MGSVRKDLAGYGLHPRKKWGQHFLVDKNIIDKIVRTAEVGIHDTVLEVGPGLGEMTLALADRAGRVVAVEIDPKLAEVLKKKTASFPNVEIIREDILKVDFDALLEAGSRPVKVVANLPYQISTPLLFRFIESRHLFSALTLMIQKEVAERMAAAPGGKEYGPLSIFVQVFSVIALCFRVKPSAFFPPPKVESAVIQVKWKGTALVDAAEEDWFRKVVRGALGYRRKTLINALRCSGLSLPDTAEDLMEKIGIDPRSRPETLTVEEFVLLANALRL